MFWGIAAGVVMLLLTSNFLAAGLAALLVGLACR